MNKLSLNRETLRSLTTQDLSGVDGGILVLRTNTCACPVLTAGCTIFHSAACTTTVTTGTSISINPGPISY